VEEDSGTTTTVVTGGASTLLPGTSSSGPSAPTAPTAPATTSGYANSSNAAGLVLPHDAAGLVQANAVQEEDEEAAAANRAQASPVDLEQERKQKEEQQRQQRRKTSMALIGAFLCMLVAVVVFAVTAEPPITNATPASPTANSNSSDTSSSTTTPPSVVDLFLQEQREEMSLLLPNCTLAAIQQNPLSPQSVAMEWIVQHPNITLFPDWKKGQAYAVATIFYAFEGPHWVEFIRNDWMTHSKSECYWCSGHTHVWVEGHGFFDYTQHGRRICNDQGELETLSLRFLKFDDVDNSTEEIDPVIPPEIELTSSLNRIDIGNNGLSSPIGHFLPMQHILPLANLIDQANVQQHGSGFAAWMSQFLAPRDDSLRNCAPGGSKQHSIENSVLQIRGKKPLLR